MKTLLTAIVFSATALACTAPADAKGCLKGAVVGGVLGHMAGGHGAAGAAAGCAVGHHHASTMDKKAQQTDAGAAK